MGIDIEAAGVSLHVKATAYLVVGWCERFETRRFTDAQACDRIGNQDYPVEVVDAAHRGVPRTYAEAAAAGFDVGTPEDFAEARRFLELAACDPDGITGSS